MFHEQFKQTKMTGWKRKSESRLNPVESTWNPLLNMGCVSDMVAFLFPEV